MTPTDPFYMRGRDGLLSFEHTTAVLLDVESGAELMRIEHARVLKARDGGLLLAGDEMHFRGVKSKGEARRQTWWCVPLTRVALRAAAESDAPPAPT